MGFPRTNRSAKLPCSPPRMNIARPTSKLACATVGTWRLMPEDSEKRGFGFWVLHICVYTVHSYSCCTMLPLAAAQSRYKVAFSGASYVQSVARGNTLMAKLGKLGVVSFQVLGITPQRFAKFRHKGVCERLYWAKSYLQTHRPSSMVYLFNG